MKNVYLRVFIQLTYFIMVLIIKIANDDTEYFQVIFSILLTVLSLPLNRYISNYAEHSQLICKSLWQVLNLFCLGSVDMGLKNDGFLSRFQYFWLGLTIQLDVDTILPNKIVRVGFLLVVIASVNLTTFYLILDSSQIGLICGEILYTLILVYQLFVEKTMKNQHKQQTSKKPSSRSFTEKLDSPQAQILDEESNHVQILSLGQQLHHQQQPQREASIREQIEYQNSFYQTLFNQFPEGIIIINDQNKIEYHNIQVRSLLGRKPISEELIPKRLAELKNYSSKFQFGEQAQFDKMFAALNKKLKSNSHEFQQQLNEENSIIKDCFVPLDEQTYYNYYEYELSKAETLSQEIEKALQDKNSTPSPYQRQVSQYSQKTQKEKIKFIKEVKMLCMIEESKEEILNEMHEDQSDDEDSAGLLIQITIKAYVYENKRNVLLIIRDVSLFNQYKVLQQQNSNKSKMLSYVAHELRNPLGAICAISAQLISKYSQDKETSKKYLKPLKSSAESISRLANDLLDLAQLKAGKFKLTFQEFAIKTLIFDAIAMMTFTVGAKNLQLSLKYDKKIPSLIKSDQQRIQQIILNLINNSTKFTKTGGIKVEAKLLQPKLIEISVEDTGVGLQPEDIKKLFQPFGKLEDSKHLNTQGVGLGLMISNVLAQKLSGGDVGLQVESKGLGQGTRFIFKILDQNETKSSVHQSQDTKYFGRKESNLSIVRVAKRDQLTLQPMSASIYRAKVISEQKIEENESTIYQFQCEDDNFQEDPVQESYENCACPRILIVDDEPINLMILGYQLKNLKYRYQQAKSGQEALDFLKGWQSTQEYCCNWIRCVIIDIQMPMMDGYQTSKLIRMMEREKQISRCAIIGCSGFSDEETKKLGFESGMDHFLSKPVTQVELQTILNQCC
ncbi:unnamed protein product [Paramecium octaurelia]|uniref:Uncharacterized protein n=1 Tax=Paramecium octaurelia TaxID=43137 RepID=A0A8S1T1H0_PAROT|nr:unnamed protein product [Paramecium octaurelia]